MKYQHDFSSNRNFLHQPSLKIKDSNGKDKEIPYGPWRYKRIIEECYFISHQIHTSYTDLLKVTPRERSYMLEFINDELRRQKESIERIKQNNQVQDIKK